MLHTQNMYDMHSTRLEMPGERKIIGQRAGGRKKNCSNTFVHVDKGRNSLTYPQV
jgi:hypothetical protein